MGLQYIPTGTANATLFVNFDTLVTSLCDVPQAGLFTSIVNAGRDAKSTTIMNLDGREDDALLSIISTRFNVRRTRWDGTTCRQESAIRSAIPAFRCKRGTFDSNLAAFKASARVGSDCQLVQSIRDQPALENECYPWLRDQLPQDCSLLDSPDRYVEALPDACKGQLELVP